MLNALRRPMVWLGCAGGLLIASAAWAQTTLVSVASDGTTQGNGPSGPSVAMSANGRFVAFASAATNFVAGDTNASVDVFVKDRDTGTIVRVSVASDGTARTGDSGVEGVDMSADGNVIVFTSRAALEAGDTNACPGSPIGGTGPSCADIYVHTRTTGETIRVSVSDTGLQADGPSRDPALSGDGGVVAFSSDATNLVSGDTNMLPDVFVRDRAASRTTRANVSTAGVQSNRFSGVPALDHTGQIVVFLSDATTLDVPDQVPCSVVSCTRAFFHVRGTGVTTRLPGIVFRFGDGPVFEGWATDVAVSADGRYVAYIFYWVPKAPQSVTAIYDRQLGVQRTVSGGGTAMAVSGDLRYIATGDAGSSSSRINVTDTLLRQGSFDQIPNPLLPGNEAYAPADMSGDGRFVLFSSGNLGPGDTNGVADVFIVDRDRDHDGMLDRWEQAFGLNPDDPADGPLDPDGDGLTNVQEYQTNGHPRGVVTRYFAEGSSNAFFETEFNLLNPNPTPARLLVHWLGADGLRSAQLFTIEPLRTLKLFGLPSGDFSTVIESDQMIVADRVMSWGTGMDAGSHGDTATQAPSTVWYLAEGATHGAFDLFYLLQNATDVAADVTIEYLRPVPLAPIVKMYTVAAHSRRTVWVDVEGPELEATDVSARISSTQPLVVERSMYFSGENHPFLAGHNGAALRAPADRWFLAEGATGPFFDLYVLVANPGDQAALLDVTYLLPDGAPIVRPYEVAPRSRRTISVEGEDVRLANTPVSTIVESTNGQPVVVERAMWWPGSGWYESALSAGSTTTGTRWGVAGMGGGEATYLLIANTSDTDGTATVRLFFNEVDPVEHVISLPARSRVNLSVADLNGEPPFAFGAVVESGGVQIVVERATYETTEGVTWSRGYAMLATKLP